LGESEQKPCDGKLFEKVRRATKARDILEFRITWTKKSLKGEEMFDVGVEG
jgi:hypothetical protein